jgi:hypothetical protein
MLCCCCNRFIAVDLIARCHHLNDSSRGSDGFRKSFGEERKRGTCARLASMMPIYGARARRRHALEHARDGEALRLDQSMVSRIWRALCAAAASSRGLNAFQRPAVHRESARYRRTLPQSADRALVLGVDEKSQIQALDRSQPLLPMRPGQAERRAPDYLRHGTTNLFAALDFKAGTVIGQFHRRHRAVEFRQFLETIDHQVPRRCALHFDHRQLRNPQTPGHQALAAASSALSSPLHAYRRFLAQPGGTLVRGPHRKTTAPRRPSQHSRTAGRHPPLPRTQQPSSKTLHLDQNR